MTERAQLDKTLPVFSQTTKQHLLRLYADETKRMLWSKAGMDTTRNIAILIVLTTILISFGFPEATSHWVTFFGSLAVFALCLFETRLFRSHAVSGLRVQLLQHNFLPALFDRQMAVQQTWKKDLAESYASPLKPAFPEALAYRIYKNYFLIFLALDTSWLSKVYLLPDPATNLSEYKQRLHLGFLSGWATIAFVILFWVVFIMAVLRIKTIKKQKPYLRGY